MSIPACGPSRRAAPEEGRELAGSGQHPGEAAGGVERGVHRGRGREHGGDRHDREPGVAERRPRGLGDRRLAVPDRPPSTVSVPKTPSEISTYSTVVTPSAPYIALGSSRVGSRRSPAAKVITLKPRYAKNVSATLARIVGEGRVVAEREQVAVDVDDRDGDEDREDAEQHDDDQRLGAIDDPGADEVDRAPSRARSPS